MSGPSPLSFDELYSPRDKIILILKKEVSYWRTRDRIEYCFYEDRKHKVLIITCYDIEKKEALRTIFVNLEQLYYEVECKARESRDLLTVKSNKKLGDDTSLHKAVSEYIIARLKISAEPLPWPFFDNNSLLQQNIQQNVTENSTPTITDNTKPITINDNTTPIITDNTSSSSITTTTAAAAAIMITNNSTNNVILGGPCERMCSLYNLASDEYVSIECSKPKASTFNIDEIPNIKLQPTIQIIENTQQQNENIIETTIVQEVTKSEESSVVQSTSLPTTSLPSTSLPSTSTKPTSKIKAIANVAKVVNSVKKNSNKVAVSG